jgi:hypothetical protein
MPKKKIKRQTIVTPAEVEKVAKPKTAWPKEVPILCAEHIYRRGWHTGDGQHDLGGWLEEIFGVDHQQGEAYDTLVSVLRERDVPEDLALWQICEDKTYKRGFLARAWNEAMRRLGYGLPEDV